MDSGKIAELKQFIEACKSNPSLLHNPSLSFFKSYLLRCLLSLSPSPSNYHSHFFFTFYVTFTAYLFTVFVAWGREREREREVREGERKERDMINKGK